MRPLRTVRQRVPFCTSALLCCLAFAAGCDSRQPLAPTPRGIARPALDASGSAIIGTAVVGPEHTSGVPVGPVPDSVWVVIQVSGQFDAKPNPVCSVQPPNWPCIFNAPASNFFDQRPFTSGPVQAWVVSTRTSQVPLRGTGGAVNTAGQAIGLYYGAAPGELQVLSALQNFGTQNPNPVGQISSWIFSGAYSATATRISNPLTFTGGPTGDPQGTVSFTVGTTAPLQFINPVGVGGAPPNVDWYFVPGDSVPLEYERTSQAWQVFSCWLKTTCTVTPPPNVNGRMQVVAYVEGRLVIGRSDYVRSACHSGAGGCNQEPKLVLRCDGHTDADSVTRGNRMECTTSPEPTGAAVADVRWEFQDAHGHVIPGPAGEMKWAGVMVVGGQMKVSGMVNGKPQTATLAVTVTARDWTGKITFPPEPQPEWVHGDPLKYPPTVAGDTLADGTLGKTQYPLPEPASGYGEGTGPNEGWYFFDQIPYFSPSSSHIFLNDALKPSDPFYQAQRGQQWGQQGQVVFGTRTCGQDFMRTAARHVPAHESGHYTRAKEFAEGAGAPLLESAVVFRTDPAEDSTAYNTMLRQYIAADSAIQTDWDKRSVLHVPCKLTVPTN